LLGEGFEGADDFPSLPASSFIPGFGVKRVSPMIGRYQCGRGNLVSWLPCVVAIGISFPLDKVLEASFAAIKAVINDGLDLVFFGIFDQLRGWPRVIDPVFCRFTIRGQEGRMKDVMDGPGRG
jgi:hypothetical protein